MMAFHQYLKTIPAVWTAGFLFVLYKEQKLQVQTTFHAFDTRSKRSALFFVVSHTVRSALLLYLIIWGELSEVNSCLEIWKRLFRFRAQWGTPEHRYLYSTPSAEQLLWGGAHTEIINLQSSEGWTLLSEGLVLHKGENVSL